MTEELVEFVLEQTTRPLDRWAVAATLESGGIRDVDARERFGRRDVFDLADEVYARCLESDPRADTEGPVEPEFRGRARTLTRLYLRGGFFFLQLALQLGSLAVLGYGQWASLDFTNRQASVVGVALLTSFLVTGGTTQAIGYLGPYFGESHKYSLEARVVSAVVGLGLTALLLGEVLLWAVNLVVGSYGGRLLGPGLVYYTLAGLISLSGALLYMLKQFAAMVVATVVGIAVVGLVLHRTSIGIYGAHWIGMAVSIGIQTGWAAAVLVRRSRRTTADLRTAIPPPSPYLAALVAPYVLYGVGYFALLFVDRAAAWSAGTHELPFTFRATYEVGLDWALISIVPAIAFLEITVNDISRLLGQLASRYGAQEASEHNRELLRFYRRHLGIVLVLLVLGSAATFGALVLAGHLNATKVSALFTEGVTLRVYAIGVLGYSFLVCGLFNGLFLFSVGKPWLILRCLAPAVVVATVAAFVLSRVFVYWAAAGGLAAGAFVFAVLAAYRARRILRSIDYHYFAAY